MKKNVFFKITINIVFILLVLVALVMIFNRPIKNQIINSYHPKVSRRVVLRAEQRQRQDTKRHRHNVSYNFKKVKSLDFETAVKARMASNQIEMVGQILVPKSGIHLPIGLGVSNTTLALAAGTMRPDQKMGTGNYPLAGHHMVNHYVLFGPLYFKTKVGDRIFLTDMKTIYQYQAYQRKFIAANRVDVVDQTRKPIVTLVTCDATGAGRLMIRGKLVNKYPLNTATPKLKRALLRPANN
ncbi:class A sortase [Lentilactobacillus diolivorans]|mgnify:CR=1 FL=1|nr:class A sortase [Lentilactobacillus diolivorans]GEP23398.1 class A sortase [Lentilactobacillus diolivorans]